MINQRHYWIDEVDGFVTLTHTGRARWSPEGYRFPATNLTMLRRAVKTLRASGYTRGV